MKKLTAILFILIALVIVFFIVRESDKNSDKKNDFFVSVDLTQKSINSGDVSIDEVSDFSEFNAMVPLFPDEVVVSTLSLDFDDDYFPDQIVAVKDSADPFIKILVCLYNATYGNFERTYKIDTVIEKTESFSLDVLDITGTHANSIIAYGITDSNESLLYAWLSEITDFSLNFREVAALKADGTILVHQIARSSAYAFSKEPGESFPIWAYTSVPGASENSLDQMHIVYDWSEETMQYEKQSEKWIYGKNINAQDLAKIFDGTEKTFGTFLNSTWLKTDSNGESVSIYFDYPQREIVFLNDDAAEVYTWESSIMRTNGLLAYAENVNVPTLLRRVGVTLVSADEIRVIATDALSLVTTQTTLWDGTYQKQGIEHIPESRIVQKSLEDEKVLSPYTELLETKMWSSDFDHTIDFTDATFSVNMGNLIKTGVYALFNEYDEVLVQFKDQTENGFLNGFYSIEVIEEEDAPMQLVLTPVTVGATQLTPNMDLKIILEEVVLEN